MASTHGRLIAGIGREPRSVGLSRRHTAGTYLGERHREQGGRRAPVANIIHILIVREEPIGYCAPVQGYLRSRPGAHAVRGVRADLYMDRVRSARLGITDLLDGNV